VASQIFFSRLFINNRRLHYDRFMHAILPRSQTDEHTHCFKHNTNSL